MNKSHCWDDCHLVGCRDIPLFAILGNHKSIMFRIVFWDVLPCKIIVDRRFRCSYCLHYHSSLMMKAVRTSETSVDNYFTRQYIPEDNSEHHSRRRENLKSHMKSMFTSDICSIKCKIVFTSAGWSYGFSTLYYSSNNFTVQRHDSRI
jgi:hypothetical protein